jgi:hypothetical protein
MRFLGVFAVRQTVYWIGMQYWCKPMRRFHSDKMKKGHQCRKKGHQCRTIVVPQRRHQNKLCNWPQKETCKGQKGILSCYMNNAKRPVHVSRMLQESYHNILRMLKECYNNVLGMLQECYYNVLGMSQECYENVLRMSQECFTNVKILGTCKVIHANYHSSYLNLLVKCS